MSTGSKPVRVLYSFPNKLGRIGFAIQPGSK
jgi:hypothetical protein